MKNLRTLIRKIIFESTQVDEQIKQIMVSGNDLDALEKALRLKYGNYVPLFHATDIETAKLIDAEGLKLTYGKNRKSFSDDLNLYFQIGKSDYVSSNRPVLYKWNAPVEFITNFGYADMDNVDIDESDLETMGINASHMSSEFGDFLLYFVWNNMSLDGMELLIMNVNDSSFPEIRPQKIN